MKFSLLVLAGALTATNASSNKLSTTPRRLENDDGAWDDAWEDNEVITANNVLTFEKCFGLIPQDDADEQSNTVQQEIKAGKAMPQASYVTAFITTDTSNANNRIVLSAGNYLSAKVKAASLEEKWFCNECNNYKDHCQNAMNYNYYNQNAQNGDANGNGRNLFYAPDCSECSSTCWENNYYDANKETAAKFVEEAAKCMETGYKDDYGVEYFIGVACGSTGDAVEIAAYLDENCVIESKTSASTVLSSMGAYNGLAISSVLTYVSQFAQGAFANPYTSCYSPLYDDPEEENQEGEDGYNEKQNYADYETSQVSQECKMIVGKSRFVVDCNPNQAEEQEAEDAYEEYGYQWWTVDVQDPEDMDEVCSVLNAKLSNNEEFGASYFYDEGASGSLYSRDRYGNLNGSANSSNKMHGGLIFLIVVLVIGAVVAPVAWRIKKKRSAAANGDTSYQGGTMA